jgi:hypothetical protein
MNALEELLSELREVCAGLEDKRLGQGPSHNRPGRIADEPTPDGVQPDGALIAECKRPPADHDDRGGPCRRLQRSAGSWAASLNPVC